MSGFGEGQTTKHEPNNTRLVRNPCHSRPGSCPARSEQWRMGGDSNPRYRIRVHTLSRRAQSTALSPIHSPVFWTGGSAYCWKMPPHQARYYARCGSPHCGIPRTDTIIPPRPPIRNGLCFFSNTSRSSGVNMRVSLDAHEEDLPPDSPGSRHPPLECARRGAGFQPGHPPDPLRALFYLPRPGRQQTQGQAAARLEGVGVHRR